MKKFLGIVLFLFLISSLYSQKASPDFTVTDIYGHTHQLYADYLDQGQYVFIDFFAVGCPSCAELSPALDTVYRDFGCNYGDVAFLGIDGYYHDSNVFQFTQNYGMTFPVASGEEGGGYQVFSDYEVTSTPHKILIDPAGKIIADYPFEISAKYYRDTLLKEKLNLRLCSGNNFWFYSLVSETDSVIGEINETKKTIQVLMPEETDLAQLRASYVAESNSIVKINGTVQVNGETINDFSQGAVIYEITSEDGNTEAWTVSVSTSSAKQIAKNTVQIYPNPIKNNFYIELNTLNSKNISSVELYDLNGKKLKIYNLNASLTSINISELSNGVYFLKFKIKDTFFFKKIVKNTLH